MENTMKHGTLKYIHQYRVSNNVDVDRQAAK